MAIRTNQVLVRGVLLKDYDTINYPDLAPFIRAASRIVDRVATCATNKGVTLSSDELTDIETWLAAHAYSMSDKPFASKSTDKASAKYSGQTGMYLEATLYGQTAVTLDPSGCLRAVANAEGKVASGFWAGRPPSAQTDYTARD